MRYVFALSLGYLAASVIPAAAGDFRIETQIYRAEDEEQPLSENLTLFHAGIVYDFLEFPETVTIFRPPAGGAGGRFILLDPAREMKMEVTTEQIEGLLAKLKTLAADQQDPSIRFLAEPRFVERSDSDDGSLVLSSEQMTYRLRTMKVADESVLTAYRQFSDWYARFNARGGMLPFPRLAVNAVLGRRKEIPTQVVLTVPAQKLNLRAEHRVDLLLSKHDRKMIEDARRQMIAFRKVDPDEFLSGRDGSVAKTAAAPE